MTNAPDSALSVERLEEAIMHEKFERDCDLNRFLRFCVDELQMPLPMSFTYRDGFDYARSILRERDELRAVVARNTCECCGSDADVPLILCGRCEDNYPICNHPTGATP